MEKREIVKIQDKTRIKKVIFNHPELMTEDSEELIKKEYYELIETEEQLYRAREEVRHLEDIFKEKKEAFKSKESLFTLEFEFTDKEVVTQESALSFKGIGNDIWGRPATY